MRKNETLEQESERHKHIQEMPGRIERMIDKVRAMKQMVIASIVALKTNRDANAGGENNGKL